MGRPVFSESQFFILQNGSFLPYITLRFLWCNSRQNICKSSRNNKLESVITHKRKIMQYDFNYLYGNFECHWAKATFQNAFPQPSWLPTELNRHLPCSLSCELSKHAVKHPPCHSMMHTHVLLCFLWRDRYLSFSTCISVKGPVPKTFVLERYCLLMPSDTSQAYQGWCFFPRRLSALQCQGWPPGASLLGEIQLEK